MLRKLGRIFNVTWRISQFLLVFLTYPVMVTSSCATERSIYSNEDALRSRINQYYENLEARNYDKCWSLLFPEEDMVSKKEYIDGIKEYNLRFVEHEIMSVTINGSKGEAKMKITTKEGQETSTDDCFDYWVLSNDIWYLTDAGRTKRME
jgi:hypothetical protein